MRLPATCRTLIAFTLLASRSAAAQPSQLAQKSAKVDQLMSALVGEASPGAAVVVIQDGKVVHQKGYGLANVETRAPITTNTTFDLASVSKQFTAMAIMMLAERGKLAYDDPITKFFPEFPAYASKITVRHLLNHTSGLPDYMAVFQQRPAGIPAEPSSRDAITMLIQIPAPRFAPGSKWEYSNSGYVVLGQIAEQAWGLSLPAFLKMNVFDPLGMKTTMVSDQVLAPAANRAISYAPDGNEFKNADYSPLNRIYGDGNVNTSVEDMVKWDQALSAERLVKQTTLDAAFTPARLNDGSSTNYGFGWTIENSNGVRVLSHGGAWVGFRTYIARVPAERFSVVVLSNAANFGPTAAAKRIGNIYLGDKMPAKQIVTVDQKTLATYVGKYQLRPGLVLDVSLEHGILFAAPTGQPKLRLGAESETRFFLTVDEDIGMTFTRDETGKVTGLTFHQRGDHPATRLPE
jgi:CubicO group peptidase (beta-lactamase class C family)